MNPFRYRSYYYDAETWFYYLQSRYYDPQICRFINADVFTSTGQGMLGNNMFAYCLNNPTIHCDILGCFPTKIDMTDQDKDGDGMPDEPAGGSPGSSGISGNTGINISGYGQAPHQGPPGSTYTQISSDGKGSVISQTTYNEYGQRGQRIDWSGRDHNIGLPHIHIYSYGYYNGMLRRTNEIVEKYFEDYYY